MMRFFLNSIHPLYILVVTLFVIAYYPAIDLLIQKWSSVDDYNHALFIALVFIYIIWQNKALFSKPASGAISAVLLILPATLLYLLSLTLQVPTFIFLSFFFVMSSYLLLFSGYKSFHRLTLPLLLFAILIPIPNQILSSITGPLQLTISEISEIIIRQLSIPMFREGNLIHIQQLSFQVVEACSGLRSLISMITMAVLITYFTLTTFRSLLVLICLSIPIALFLNLVRVSGMIVVYHYFSIDLSIGVYHTLFGLFLFILGVSLLLSTQRILENWEVKRNYKS